METLVFIKNLFVDPLVTSLKNYKLQNTRKYLSAILKDNYQYLLFLLELLISIKREWVES